MDRSTQNPYIADNVGPIDYRTIAIDGTKIKGNAQAGIRVGNGLLAGAIRASVSPDTFDYARGTRARPSQNERPSSGPPETRPRASGGRMADSGYRIQSAAYFLIRASVAGLKMPER
jgi:hypothetical protein